MAAPHQVALRIAISGCDSCGGVVRAATCGKGVVLRVCWGLESMKGAVISMPYYYALIMLTCGPITPYCY